MWKFNFSFGKEKPTPVESQKIQVITESQPEISDNDFEAKYGEIIRRQFKKFNDSLIPVDQEAIADENSNKPIMAGRSSVYEGYRSFLPNINAPVPTDFNFKMIRFLQQMAIWNRHISYAVDNIVTLGNTEYEVGFGESMREADVRRMREHLRNVVPNWYEFGAGENTLDNDLLAQQASTGVISAESTIKNDLSGVRKIVRVDPFFIRFAYDGQLDQHIPLQQLAYLNDPNKTKGKYFGYIELNPATYSYMAMRRFSELPYGIPPFVSAIEDLLTENDMVANMRNVMRRMGMLGFMEVLLEAPKPVNESPAQYQNKLAAYLEEVRPQVEQGFSRGVAIGFKGSHEFKLTGTDMNADGAESLMKIVKSLIFAGVKQDPNMHGENYSVTETFGNVILKKMTQQVANYQLTLAAFKAKVFKLELLLNGMFPPVVEVKYAKPAIGNLFKEAQTRALDIANADSLYRQGIINQAKKAAMLGYDRSDLPGYRILEVPPGTLLDSTQPGMPDESAGGDPAASTETAKKKSKSRG